MALTFPAKRILAMTIFPVMMIVGLLFYYLAFVSVASRITMLNNNINTAIFPSIKDVPAARVEPGDILTEKKRINDLFHRKIPDEPSVPQTLSRLIHIAGDMGITDISFTTGNKVLAWFDVIGGKQIYQWPVTLRIKSDYFQLTRLLLEISNSERQIDILEAEMSRAAPRIKTRLNLAVYSLNR